MAARATDLTRRGADLRARPQHLGPDAEGAFRTWRQGRRLRQALGLTEIDVLGFSIGGMDDASFITDAELVVDGGAAQV